MDFYTGYSLGIDFGSGAAVLTLTELHPGIKLHCIVPFAAQDQKWTLEQQARYHALLDQSCDVILTHEEYNEDCHYIRNRYPLDHADAVLTIYDLNTDKRSGTGYIVHYAQAQGMPIMASDPDDFRSSFFGTETQKKYLNFFQKSCDQSEQNRTYGVKGL